MPAISISLALTHIFLHAYIYIYVHMTLCNVQMCMHISHRFAFAMRCAKIARNFPPQHRNFQQIAANAQSYYHIPVQAYR